MYRKVAGFLPGPAVLRTAGGCVDELHALVSRVSSGNHVVIVGDLFGGFMARICAGRHCGPPHRLVRAGR